MISIKQEFEQLEFGTPQYFRNLTLFPLLRREATGEPQYALLEDVILQGEAKVTELNGAGVVPELRFENNSARPVLLLDGEELIGAKQNRVLNLTILAPSRQTVEIPVSCVEAGRWHMQTPDFRPAAYLMFGRARATRAVHVTESMRTTGTRRSDQSALWSEIAQKLSNLGTRSPTQAMSAIYEGHAVSVEEYVRAFAWKERQAGVAFAITGRLLGLDLFDHPATMRRVLPKLVRSYALDALDSPPAAEGASVSQLVEFLAQVTSAPSFSQPAVGLGKDVRLGGPAITGAALYAEDRYIHVCAFRADAIGVEGGFQTRMSRPSRRGMS